MSCVAWKRCAIDLESCSVLSSRSTSLQQDGFIAVTEHVLMYRKFCARYVPIFLINRVCSIEPLAPTLKIREQKTRIAKSHLYPALQHKERVHLDSSSTAIHTNPPLDSSLNWTNIQVPINNSLIPIPHLQPLIRFLEMSAIKLVPISQHQHFQNKVR